MPYWAALRARLAGLRERASDGLARAVAADHTTHEIAATFALGTVVVVLPTAGTALVVFAAVAYLFRVGGDAGRLQPAGEVDDIRRQLLARNSRVGSRARGHAVGRGA